MRPERKITSFLLIAGVLLGMGSANAQTSENISEIYQKGTSNKTIVDQDGAGNISSIITSGSRSTVLVDQNNIHNFETTNHFTSRSQGNDNLVSAEQINAADTSVDNVAIVYQGGDRNSAFVSQGIASLVLGGDGNYASVIQYGDDHEAYVNQSGDSNYASLEQHGLANKGELIQNGSGLSAELTQSGTGLGYSITQSGCAVAGGCGTIVVTQTGP